MIPFISPAAYARVADARGKNGFAATRVTPRASASLRRFAAWPPAVRRLRNTRDTASECLAAQACFREFGRGTSVFFDPLFVLVNAFL